MNGLIRQLLAAILTITLAIPLSAIASDPNAMNGSVTYTYDYDAFGNLIHSTGSTYNNYLFAGEQFDPDLGLYYNRARYLNTGTGRFSSMDMFDGDSQAPRSLHKYVYAGDDAVNQKDPSGNDSIAEFSVATTVNVALSTMAVLSVGAAINAAYGLSNLPKNPFSRLPDAGVVGFQLTANVGRVLRKFAQSPLEVGLSIGLQFLSVGGGFEFVVPRTLDTVWTFGFYGAFYSLPIGAGAAAGNDGFLKDFPGINVLPGVNADFLDAAVYGGGAWNVKQYSDYEGPFQCVSGAAVLRLVGLTARPDATVCSSPPKDDGTAGAYSLLYNRLGSGSSVGTSITNYSYLGSFRPW
jgi:RHS repeat-associated protein